MNKISLMLDSVADRLEAKGFVKEALEIDKVADHMVDVEEDKLAEFMQSYLAEYQHIKNLRSQFSDRRNLIVPDEEKLIKMRKELFQFLSSFDR